jgi:DNA-binding transcriptional ArsR family regulator
MAINRSEEFTPIDQKLSNLSKAMSHPARIAILRVLAEKDTCICGEIVEVLPLAQSTVSQHLKELLNAGLIKGTVDGKKSCYCINWDTFGDYSNNFNALFGELKIAASKLNNEQNCTPGSACC